MHCTALLCYIAVRSNAMQCTYHCNTVQCNTVHLFTAIQCNAVHLPHLHLPNFFHVQQPVLWYCTTPMPCHAMPWCPCHGAHAMVPMPGAHVMPHHDHAMVTVIMILCHPAMIVCCHIMMSYCHDDMLS